MRTSCRRKGGTVGLQRRYHSTSLKGDHTAITAPAAPCIHAADARPLPRRAPSDRFAFRFARDNAADHGGMPEGAIDANESERNMGLERFDALVTKTIGIPPFLHMPRATRRSRAMHFHAAGRTRDGSRVGWRGRARIPHGLAHRETPYRAGLKR
jgi:hypothetical protein